MIFFVDYLVVCHIDIISAIKQRYYTRLYEFIYYYMWTFFVVVEILQRLTTASLNIISYRIRSILFHISISVLKLRKYKKSSKRIKKHFM